MNSWMLKSWLCVGIGIESVVFHVDELMQRVLDGDEITGIMHHYACTLRCRVQRVLGLFAFSTI